MIRLITSIAALIAAALLSVTAIAGDKDKHGMDRHDMKSTAATFDSLDRNADSQISKTEAGADRALSERFAECDTNGDGYVSRSEYMARTKS